MYIYIILSFTSVSTLNLSFVFGRHAAGKCSSANRRFQMSRETDNAFTLILERFSIERRKTKTKVITLANHQSHKHYSTPIKTRSNYM